MIGCLWTPVHKQPIIALYFEFENDLKLNNLGAKGQVQSLLYVSNTVKRLFYSLGHSK